MKAIVIESGRQTGVLKLGEDGLGAFRAVVSDDDSFHGIRNG
jgi:hypothetical protein